MNIPTVLHINKAFNVGTFKIANILFNGLDCLLSKAKGGQGRMRRYHPVKQLLHQRGLQQVLELQF